MPHSVAGREAGAEDGAVTSGFPYLLPLRGPIKTYTWGSRTVLAGLQARDAPAAEPEAELWLGAHPQGVAQVASGRQWVSLRDAIERSPVEFLGGVSVERFGAELPFLLKVLAIERPLSLQAHPNREQAAAGFRRERAAGIAPEDGCYRDARHKPELIVALEPLWLLRGLLEPAEIRRRFAEAGLTSFEDESERLARRGVEGLRDFLAALLGLTGERRARVLDEALDAVEKGAEASESKKEPRDHPRYWLARLLELHPGDPAALSPLFLHLVRLSPGQGIFQPPRILHSYLEGAGIEVMASSDNVVRAGLTSKPVDIEAALMVVDVAPSTPALIEPCLEAVTDVARYATPAGEFELVRLEASPGRDAVLEDSPALLLGLCTRGAGRLEARDRGESLDLSPGAAFAVRPGAGGVQVIGDLCLFGATVRRGSPS